jgi:hypothetical protein
VSLSVGYIYLSFTRTREDAHLGCSFLPFDSFSGCVIGRTTGRLDVIAAHSRAVGWRRSTFISPQPTLCGALVRRRLLSGTR